MHTPDIDELQRQLAQAQSECARWSRSGDEARLRETRFVVALLTLRIRHGRGLAAGHAREGTGNVASRLRDTVPPS